MRLELLVALLILSLARSGQAVVHADGAVTCSDGRTLSLTGLSGVVITAANVSVYASASLNWNANPQIGAQLPCVIVFAQVAADAAAALAWARAAELPFAVRSGRHSYEGFSLSAGLVIDLTALNATVLEPTREPATGRALVTVGAGARLVDVYLFAAAAGLVFPGGSCPTVGVGGFTLGGGFGLSSRLAGLAIDSVVSIDFVLPTGARVAVNATSEPELFWALRGGGNGNFGIALAFTFALAPLPTADGNVTVVELNWASFAPAVKSGVLSALTAWLADAPPTVTTETTVYHHSIAVLALVWANVSEAQTIMAPLAAAAGGATTATFTSSTYLAAMLNFAGCDTPAACTALALTVPDAATPIYWKAKSFYAFAPLSPAALATIVQFLEPVPANCCTGFSGLIVDSYGGAIALVAPNATAFPHREAVVHMQMMVYFNSTEQAAGAQAWAAQFGDALAAQLGPRASYRNYPDLDLGGGYADAYWGANLPALSAIKARVDPDNAFAYAQSVPMPQSGNHARVS